MSSGMTNRARCVTLLWNFLEAWPLA